MSVAVDQPQVSSGTDALLPAVAAAEFRPRPLPTAWPATCLSEPELLVWLMSPPFVLEQSAKQSRRVGGLKLIVAWLADQPGETWQQRWLSSGADDAVGAWRQVPVGWLHAHDHRTAYRHEALVEALPVLVSADAIRPSLRWLVGGGPARGGLLLRTLVASRDPGGFARLAAACDAAPGVSVVARGQTLYRAAMIVAAKGGVLGDIVVGDLLELFDAQADAYDNPSAGRTLFYRLLHDMGTFGPAAPPTLRALRTAGQRNPDELIDRYRLKCRPVRDLLVDYLRERQPALDYNSLESLANFLGKLFWSDLERHHPGIDSLHLSIAVADAWKRRLRTVTKTVTTPAGEKAEVVVERINYRECLTPVRAFYLDLAHWAVEDPARWAAWVARCPVGAEEINRRKAKRKLKSRMDSRTRERLPVLPVVVRCVADRRNCRGRTPRISPPSRAGGAVHGCGTHAGPLRRRGSLGCWQGLGARPCRRPTPRPGARRRPRLLGLGHRRGATRDRCPCRRTTANSVTTAWSNTACPPPARSSRCFRSFLPRPTPNASWSSAPSWPTSSAPSSCVSATGPEPSRSSPPTTPTNECGRLQHHCCFSVVSTPNPGLSPTAWSAPCSAALWPTPASSTPPTGNHCATRHMTSDGCSSPTQCSTGYPPHIAQIIAGHRDINVTMGYKAVYPEEAVQAHLAFLARRRSLRPSDEYRTPTDEEWQEFLGHFEKRKVSIGTCARAFSTPCIHEHACVRCPMLWPDPDQQPRLVEIRDNLKGRIAEAEREGWHGEVEGLKISLAGADEKLAQIDNRSHTVNLRIPVRQRSTAPK